MEDFNMDDTRAYIEMLTGDPDSPMAWRCINPNLKGLERVFKAVGPLSEYQERLQQLNRDGYDVYAMVNGTKGKGQTTQDVVKARALFVDKDAELKDARGYPIKPGVLPPLSVKPTMTIQSGGGQHAYWSVTDVTLDNFTEHQTTLYTRLDTDESVTDLPRIMRVPGFFWLKGFGWEARKLTKVIDYTPVQYTCAELLDNLENPRENDPTIKGTRAYAMQALDDAAARLSQAIEGERNTVLNREAYHMGAYVANGKLDEDVYTRVFMAAGDACDISADEIEGTLYSALTAAKRDVDNAAHPTLAADRTKVFTSSNAVDLAESIVDDLTPAHLAVVSDSLLYRYNAARQVWEEVRKPSALIQTYHNSALRRKDKEGLLKLDPGKIKGVSECLLNVARIQRPVDFFSTGPGEAGVLFQNTWVGLDEDCELITREPNPGLRAMFQQPYVYDPNAQCPLWMAFLESVWGDQDDDEIKGRTALLGAWLGSTMLGRATTHEKFLLLYGPQGRNGKSVMLKIIRGVFPPETVASVSPQDFGKAEARARLMPPVRLNIIAEMSRKLLDDTHLFKSIISGDTIDARRLYKDGISFAPRAGHIVAANELPPLTEHTESIWERMAMLSFTRVFKDSTLRPEEIINPILEEAPGIINWALKLGAQSLADRKLPLLKSSRQEVEAWRTKVNPVARWVQEACQLDGNEAMPARQAFTLYRMWADAEGHLSRINSQTFSDRLLALKVKKTRTKAGTFYGLKMIGENDQKVLSGAATLRALTID